MHNFREDRLDGICESAQVTKVNTTTIKQGR